MQEEPFSRMTAKLGPFLVRKTIEAIPGAWFSSVGEPLNRTTTSPFALFQRDIHWPSWRWAEILFQFKREASHSVKSNVQVVKFAYKATIRSLSTSQIRRP